MIDAKALKNDLVKQVKALENDLREQITALPETHDRLRAEYDRAFEVGRTAATWTTWRDERVTQTAVAWILGTVFVRFTEDNELMPPFLTGPTPDRRVLAEEAQEDYFHRNPSHTDRDWLLAAFEEIARSDAGRLLFDQNHNPLYQIKISHDAAKDLIIFWRHRNDEGELIHQFMSEDRDTRFLGDLYQDLSESTRKSYALLQTPDFIETFILEHTLNPAIEAFGLEGLLNEDDAPFRMIDPTCGSGHFVIGAFRRILEALREQAKSRDQRELVRLALKAVHGVDINPFAIAIARFRLFVEAFTESGFDTLAELANYELPLNLAIGDSLIRGRQDVVAEDGEKDPLLTFYYQAEDIQDFPGILSENTYHVVVGNPPYITVKDKSLNGLYREMYKSCLGAYALSVPFIERFFELSLLGNKKAGLPGYVGQITANSFMKREFGRKLIEDFFVNKVELTHVVDVSGVYIPGHGTPTVILFGRNREKSASPRMVVRAVLGVRGEPVAPKVPRDGKVWRAIVSNIDNPGTENEWISVVDVKRDFFGVHPWSLGGGGALAVKALIEESGVRLLGHVANVGTSAVTRENDVFIVGEEVLRRANIAPEFRRPLLDGNCLRDWTIVTDQIAIWPYDRETLDAKTSSEIVKFLWPFRVRLAIRTAFGRTQLERGLSWTAYSMFFIERLRGPTIAFPFVATHNHFVLDERERVFNRTAPIIKLKKGLAGDQMVLLSVLNSSTACFWFKQVSHSKGNEGHQSGIKTEMWERFYEFATSKIKDFPLPSTSSGDRGALLIELGRKLHSMVPEVLAEQDSVPRLTFIEARERWEGLRDQMIAEQEELDWEIYHHYGLIDSNLACPIGTLPALKLGERAFEIVLARRMKRGEIDTKWFVRHGSTPIVELPSTWPLKYRTVVEKRIELIESNRNIRLIEQPEYKRRWVTEDYDVMRERALRNRLLRWMEKPGIWFQDLDGMEQPRLLTTIQIADEFRKDMDAVSLVEQYGPGMNMEKVVSELVEAEHVPYLAALRYKAGGLRKRADWEHVWDMQRREDAALDESEKKRIRDSIPVPPKYGSGDFLRTSYWRNRGKLDVPKERFISYPFAGRDGASSTKDGALLLGWAGFDHREQAQALATLIVERHQNDGWGAEALTPLLAGLREVLPWVRQWHDEFDPNYGGTPAEVYEGHLDQYMSLLELTEEDLVGWRPSAARRGRAKRGG